MDTFSFPATAAVCCRFLLSFAAHTIIIIASSSSSGYVANSGVILVTAMKAFVFCRFVGLWPLSYLLGLWILKCYIVGILKFT